jgi:hypothetical protein
MGAVVDECPPLGRLREALVNEGLTRPQRRNLMADEF